MSVRAKLRQGIEKFSEGVVPGVVSGVQGVRQRLERLNRSLASKAIPEDRRQRVGELSLRQKAEQAGQKTPGQ